jgi:hypothetical protein
MFEKYARINTVLDTHCLLTPQLAMELVLELSNHFSNTEPIAYTLPPIRRQLKYLFLTHLVWSLFMLFNSPFSTDD